MNFLQILQLILSLAPNAVTLTQDVVNIIQEIESVISGLEPVTQKQVATVAAKALVANVNAL